MLHSFLRKVPFLFSFCRYQFANLSRKCPNLLPNVYFLPTFQNLVMEYFKGNQWGRSSRPPSSQKSWFWKDISWSSGSKDDCFCKNYSPSNRILSVYDGIWPCHDIFSLEMILVKALISPIKR